jgi:uncharacterized protein
MDGIKFIGRSSELKLLNDLIAKKASSLVVIKGRRRVGKSRLVEEFAKNQRFYRFSGLAPVSGIDAQAQRNEFSLQLSHQTNIPELQVEDWTKLFNLLADKSNKGRVIILFDEITWMSQGDPTFLSKLKNAWDLYFRQNPKLILILCGSVSAWIEKNIISSSGFFGRISLNLTIKELPLQDCNQLFEALRFRHSVMEKLSLLSLTGGVPWYLEQVNPKYSANDNIRDMCFRQNSILSMEYKNIFHDLFGTRSLIYQKIIILLANGDLSYDAISHKLNYAKSSSLSDYLQELIWSGYVDCYNSWSLKTGKTSTKLKKYRLTDNFLRFYFRYMQNKLSLIQAGNYANVNPSNLVGWQTMLGLQFENLVLQNKELIFAALSLKPEDIVASGPYFQKKNSRQKGCQIDYLIQTKYRTLYVCEIKFSQNPHTVEVINKTKEKINRMSLPKNYAVVPVLIHVGEVTKVVADADYFINIINIGEYLV